MKMPFFYTLRAFQTSRNYFEFIAWNHWIFFTIIGKGDLACAITKRLKEAMTK